jgi:uncharacterized protein (DUF885 family)
MVYYDKDHLTAQYNESLNAVVMEWHDFAQGEPFRDGLDAGLELVQKENAENWLADLREMGTVSDSDQEWSNNNWFPRAMETSLSHMSIVQPESVIANMSVENIMQEVGDGEMKTHYFDSRSEATQWLRNQSVTP